MEISSSKKFLLTHILIIVFISAIGGGFFSIIAFGTSSYYIIQGVLIGVLISACISMTNIFFFQKYRKKARLIVSLLFENLTYAVIITAIPVIIGTIFKNEVILRFENIIFTVIFSFFLTFFFSSTMDLFRLLGPRTFKSFLTGKYYKPKEENLIFMFLDIKNSTTLAEKIGNKKFLSFLSEFYIIISDPILRFKGEIYKYIGDEIIITWDLQKSFGKSSCIECFFEIQKLIKKNKDFFQREFGILPEFRASLHSGLVSIGEMGFLKAEVAILGDVVNTTARIQEECKTHKKDLLISKDLLYKLDLPENFATEDLGIISLRGKENKIQLFALKQREK
ncbi:adenylate/guanylate cyclase domain-containing protein [Candidatus Dependentiae bacterium]|nr:adenylate/guanylate cyclase domain-containing protein [Candidatus Dependentiae bacterium]